LGVPFDWFGFMYFDDMPLGFKAWSMKFKVISLLIEAVDTSEALVEV
jgi:hypothetical protein